MRMWMLTVGAAALAITTPALADPKEGGKGKGQAAQAERGGGKAKARGAEQRQVKADRGNRADTKVQGDDRRSAKAVRLEDRGDRGKRDVVRVHDLDGDGFVRRWGQHGFARGFVNGCPPGLAKKNNDCLPPGQEKKLVGSILSSAFRTNALIGPYRDWYRDDDRFFYRMSQDGLIYRVNRSNSLIDALIPGSFNDFGYYPVGMTYPSAYNFYNVPMQYGSYWPDGDYNYRYGNGAIYQVNPQTSMIQGIVALLAGDLSVGQRMPQGYSAYNVPFAYRERYSDTQDDWYRYNDGYIYRVDPTTQLITAVIQALV